jgi:hypothetical protein
MGESELCLQHVHAANRAQCDDGQRDRAAHLEDVLHAVGRRHAPVAGVDGVCEHDEKAGNNAL